MPGYKKQQFAEFLQKVCSPICYFGVALVKKKLKIDDVPDVFGCHEIGGIWECKNETSSVKFRLFKALNQNREVFLTLNGFFIPLWGL